MKKRLNHCKYFSFFFGVDHNSCRFIKDVTTREYFVSMIQIQRKLAESLEKTISSNNGDLSLIIRIVVQANGYLAHIKEAISSEWGGRQIELKDVIEINYRKLKEKPFDEKFIVNKIYASYNKIKIDLFIIKIFLAEKFLQEIAKEIGLKNEDINVKIQRIFNFPIEFKQAGISILSYFGTVINQKYPALELCVTVSQKGEQIILVIELPEDSEDLVEKALEDYGSVISGRMPPEKLLKDDNHVNQLVKQLMLANFGQNTDEKIHLLISAYQMQINSLDNERNNLQKALAASINERDSLHSILKEAIQGSHGNLHSALLSLNRIIQTSAIPSDDNAALAPLNLIKENNPGLFRKIYDAILLGGISGASGNFLHVWMAELIKKFFK